MTWVDDMEWREFQTDFGSKRWRQTETKIRQIFTRERRMRQKMTFLQVDERGLGF